MAVISASLLSVVLAGACAAGVSALGSGQAQAPAQPAVGAPSPGMVAVRARDLVVTSGFLELEAGPLPLEDSSLAEEFRISAPVLRAWVGQQPRAAVEIEFTYLGPTAVDVPLASGELRRQIGVELRARDSCNLLYVMWRIEPVPQLVVSLKQNPAQHQHGECGDRGYLTLPPSTSEPLPVLRVGAPHVLCAAVSGPELDVQVDGRSRWRGRLPSAALALDGPVGLRSDNGQFDVRMRAGSVQP